MSVSVKGLRTECGWDENAFPTPEQWRYVFLRLPEDEQIKWAWRACEANEVAHRCFLMDHEGAIAEVRTIGPRLAEAERRGALNALAELSAAIETAI